MLLKISGDILDDHIFADLMIRSEVTQVYQFGDLIIC